MLKIDDVSEKREFIKVKVSVLNHGVAAAGFARGTGVCFSTWLAVAHSASLAGLFLPVFFTTRNYFKP
jgi:hypothetical protein